MARYSIDKQSLWAGATLSAVIHFGPVVVAVFGLYELFDDNPVQSPPPIQVSIVIPDSAGGFLAQDPRDEIDPGNTQEETEEEMAAIPADGVDDVPILPENVNLAPKGDAGDLANRDNTGEDEMRGVTSEAADLSSSNPNISEIVGAGELEDALLDLKTRDDRIPDQPLDMITTQAGMQASEPEIDVMPSTIEALEGVPNDVEANDAETNDAEVAETPVATGAQTDAANVSDISSENIPPLETAAVDSPSSNPQSNDQTASPDQIKFAVPPSFDSLAEISEFLAEGLEKIREDIENGDLSPQDVASQLQEEAEQGDSEAQYTLAALYQLGLGVAKDPAAAVVWYRTAAEKRFVDAQVRLGDMLAAIESPGFSPVEAQSWWQIAAQTGEPVAVAGAALLDNDLSAADIAKATTKAKRIEKLWLSWQRWADASSKGELAKQLITAAESGDTAAIKRLISDGANPNTADAGNRSALLLSVMAGYGESAEALLRRGAVVDTADSNGQSALMWAAKNGHTNVAELLLERGANIAARDQYGQTALIEAAWRGHTKIVALLLQTDADVNARSSEGVTALMWAARNGYPETARKLIAVGADLEIPDNALYTPLLRAAWNGHVEVVSVLLKSGAMVDVESINGDTALRLAQDNGFVKIAAMLTIAGARR